MMCVRLLIYKESIDFNILLKMSCFIIIGVIIYSSLTFGQAFFHSDTATASLLLRTQIKDRALFPDSWCYANGELWVLTLNLFVAPFFFFIKNQLLVRQLGSVLLIVCALISIRYQSKKLFANKSWLLSIPLLFVFCSSFVSYDMNLWQAANTSYIIWQATLITFIWEFLSTVGKEKKIYFGLIIVQTFLLSLAGIRVFAELIIPIAFVFILFFAENYSPMQRNQFLVGFLLSAILGLIIYKYIMLSHIANDTENNTIIFVPSIQICINNFKIYIQNIFTLFGFEGSARFFSLAGIKCFIAVCTCFLAFFIFPILQLLKIKQEKKGIQFFILFVFFHNILFFFICIFFGKTIDRYSLSSVHLNIVLSSNYLYNYLFAKSSINIRNIFFVSFIVCSIICSFSLVKKPNWFKIVTKQKKLTELILSNNLSKGYATYWNAYKNEIYSDFKIQFGGINLTEKGLTPFFWLVDKRVFSYDENCATFLLLRDDEYNYVINNNLLEIIGYPRKELKYENYYILIYSYDIAQFFRPGNI